MKKRLIRRRWSNRVRKAFLLAALLLLGLAASTQGGPAPAPESPFVRALHDCQDDYGASNSRVDQTGHDLVALDIAETGRKPVTGGTARPMVVFRITESAHAFNPGSQSDNFDTFRRDRLRFQIDGDATRVFDVIMETEDDETWNRVSGTKWDHINTNVSLPSDPDGLARKAYDIGFFYSTLGLRTGERITDFRMESYEVRNGEYVLGDYMPGGFMDHLRQQYQGQDHDKFLCPDAPPGGDPAFYELVPGVLMESSDLPNRPPTVSFSYTPLDPTTSTDIRFSDTSVDPDGDRITKWLWRFDDGDVATETARPLHRYSERGTYAVELVVEDHLGASAAVTLPVVVRNTPPVVTFMEASPRSPVVGERVQFQQVAFDADGEVTDYKWNFGDGSNFSLETAPAHVYQNAGVFTVSLEIADDDGGRASNTLTLQVRGTGSEPIDAPPSASFSMQPARAKVGQDITFTDTSRDDQGIASRQWDFGDNVTAQGASTTHRYGVPGVYVVRLTVTDSLGQNDFVTRSITVDAATAATDSNNTGATDDLPAVAPVAAFDYQPEQIFVDDEVTFTDQSRTEQGTIDKWTWTFGDGGRSSFQDPTHIYREPGRYKVTLLVANSADSFATHSEFIDVVSPGGPQPGNEVPAPALLMVLGVLAILAGLVARRQRA